jgi:hypothetical protein
MRALATKGRHVFRCWRRSRKPRPACFQHASLRVRGLSVIGAILWGALAFAPATPAQAQCANCGCEAAAHDFLRGVILAEHIGTRTHVTYEFELHRVDFVIDRWFRLYLLNAMMSMTEELSAVAMQQMWMLGEMFDAKQQLETQRLFEDLKADAHRDYQPSTDMCVFGTAARGLASGQQRGILGQHIIAQRALDRTLNSQDTMAGEGRGMDVKARMSLFIRRNCDFHDNNDRLEKLCSATVSTPAQTLPREQTSNKDIDYTRLVDMPMTIRADFTNATVTDEDEDEPDILAMATNLYQNKILEPPSGSFFENDNNRYLYMDARALAAKRSVAQNSFGAIVGMKLSGSDISEDTRGYMRALLMQMGLTDEDDIERFLGTRPSYNAHMEVLTKKLYQRPEFYTNLYDTEANVERKIASMRAIGLMQDFDMFKSHLRNEAMLSVLLETELGREQDRVADTLNNPPEEGFQ